MTKKSKIKERLENRFSDIINEGFYDDKVEDGLKVNGKVFKPSDYKFSRPYEITDAGFSKGTVESPVAFEAFKRRHSRGGYPGYGEELEPQDQKIHDKFYKDLRAAGGSNSAASSWKGD